MSEYQGIVKGKIVEVRFALSGKITKVNKTIGDHVNKMDLIASLDRKILQAELDRQLADFEKTRAEFEIFNQKNPNPLSDLDKYLKTGKQADLNASVKDVEISKAKLDQCDLISPIDGIVIDDGNITEGTFITPSNSPVSILDTNSLYFEFEILQSDLQNFSDPIAVTLNIDGFTEQMQGTTLPAFSDGKKLTVKVKLNKNPKLLLGLKGKAVL